jgi:hypothetical protein
VKKIEAALNILKSYNYLGEKKVADDTLLIGKAPHIAEQAWLHTIYSPLADRGITLIENSISKNIPADFKTFLRISNGLNVFNTTFCLFGIRENYKRTHDAVLQPFDIIIPNTIEKPKGLNNKNIIIGYYDWNGSYIHIDTQTNKVHLSERETTKSLYEWKNFDDMLHSEIKRLCRLFDKEGCELFPDISTLPKH